MRKGVSDVRRFLGQSNLLREIGGAEGIGSQADVAWSFDGSSGPFSTVWWVALSGFSVGMGRSLDNGVGHRRMSRRDQAVTVF